MVVGDETAAMELLRCPVGPVASGADGPGQGLEGARRSGRQSNHTVGCEPAISSWPRVATAPMCREHGSVVVVLPASALFAGDREEDRWAGSRSTLIPTSATSRSPRPVR